MNTKASRDFIKLFKLLSIACGAWTAFFGLAVLAGWAWNITLLKSIRPEYIPIKANIALLFLMSGLSLIFAQDLKKIPYLRLISEVLAALVVLIAVLTFAENISGVDLGIDQMLFREPPHPFSQTAPGRMSPTTAFTFAILGLALFFPNFKTYEGKMPAQFLGILAFLNALIGFLAYLYNVGAFGGISIYAQTAFYTTITFLILSLGVFFVRSEEDVMSVITSDTYGGKTARWLLPMGIAIPVLLGYLELKGLAYGYYDEILGLALLVLSSIIIFSSLIWQYSRVIDLTDKEHKKLEKAKEEFVSLASHQLRSPLTAIKGYSEFLLDGTDGAVNDRQKEHINIIVESNNKMLGLIDALLNVSRIDLAIFAIEPVPLNIIEAAEKAMREIILTAEAKKIKIDKKFSPDFPLIPLDPKLIGIIFQNLLSNAVKYTPEGGSVYFEVTQKNSQINIIVKDTGMGVPKDQQDRIFSKMFRASNAVEKISEGTGLGLYIVKSIAEACGGKIWFKSPASLSAVASAQADAQAASGKAENPGTAFYITLPLSGMKKREGAKGLS